MAAELLAIRLELALSVALLAVGAVMALSSANVAKRVAGLLIAHLAVLVALAALKVGGAVLMAGLGVCLAVLLLGVALLVRLQEAYGAVETLELDAADTQSEPLEPMA
jgi:hypothetical protein